MDKVIPIIFLIFVFWFLWVAFKFIRFLYLSIVKPASDVEPAVIYGYDYKNDYKDKWVESNEDMQSIKVEPTSCAESEVISTHFEQAEAPNPKIDDNEKPANTEHKLVDNEVLDKDSSYGKKGDNPFQSPIVSQMKLIGEINWEFPYLPSLIKLCVLLVSICVSSLLFITIGIIYQIEFNLRLMIGEYDKKTPDDLVEKSGHFIVIGIFALFWIPFFLVLLPFYILGYGWKTLGFKGFLLIALLSIGGWFYFDIFVTSVERLSQRP